MPTPPEAATIENRTVSASAVVTAPPEKIFALLANPHRHHEFDGSGTVTGAASGPERLTLGARFGMKMRNGLPYRTSNRVVEFEPDRRIAWCHVARAVWRYELEPVDGGTKVTETFDYSTTPLGRGFDLMGLPKGNAKSIRETLVRLQAIFA